VRKLKSVYSSVDDVDLFVGGFMELARGDAIVGPTFKCILGDQFARLKLGDRFFYDLGAEANGTAFTPAQLQEIRKTSMARILCDNTDIRSIQPQAFKTAGSSRTNKVQLCTSVNIPAVNFSPFRERRRRNN